MWQVEDLIRSFKFDIETIGGEIIGKYPLDEETREEMKAWYIDLIQRMNKENIRDSGHLQSLNELVEELNHLHHQLLNDAEENRYHEFYRAARPNIQAFRMKSKETFSNEIDTCFHALYSLFLMKLAKKEVGSETAKAMKTISNLLAYLAVRYKEK